MATFKDDLNLPNNSTLATKLQQMKFGDFVRGSTARLYHQAPAAGLYNDATATALALPDDAKSSTLGRVYVRAGGVTGEFVVDPGIEVAPVTGHAGVSPSGDIVFLAADLVTDADVEYEPAALTSKEFTAACVPATGLVTLSGAVLDALGKSRMVIIEEAEILVGTAAGKKIVGLPAAGAPAAGHARLSIAKTSVFFAIADGASSVRLKLGLIPSVDLNALLEAASPSV